MHSPQQHGQQAHRRELLLRQQRKDEPPRSRSASPGSARWSGGPRSRHPSCGAAPASPRCQLKSPRSTYMHRMGRTTSKNRCATWSVASASLGWPRAPNARVVPQAGPAQSQPQCEWQPTNQAAIEGYGQAVTKPTRRRLAGNSGLERMSWAPACLHALVGVARHLQVGDISSCCSEKSVCQKMLRKGQSIRELRGPGTINIHGGNAQGQGCTYSPPRIALAGPSLLEDGVERRVIESMSIAILAAPLLQPREPCGCPSPPW